MTIRNNPALRRMLMRKALGNRAMIKKGLPANRYSRHALNLLRRRGMTTSSAPARYAGRSMRHTRPKMRLYGSGAG